MVVLEAAVVVAVVDAFTKYVATGHLAEGRMYGVGGSWGVRRVQNSRGALVGLPVGYAFLLWLGAAAVAEWAVVVSPAASGPLAIGLGMTLGGAAGNLLDRLLRGSVVDFVAAGPWPVFNLADAAMAFGLLLAVGSLL